MLTDPSTPFTERTEEKFNHLKKKFKSMMNIWLPEAERKEIVAAMKDLHQGNWFKCSNGHIYAIGECGEAVETSTCPECREDIGGVERVLVRTSRAALEMDGDVTRKAAKWNLND